jgi:hypothetical protein
MFPAAMNSNNLARGNAVPPRAARLKTTLRNEDDFPRGAGLEDFFVGARCFRKR